MLQPSRPDSSPDLNPLDAFEQEIDEIPAELNESVPTAPPPIPVPAAPESHRLEVAEAEILKLRSEVATLVGVINDIARQLKSADRPEEAKAERPVHVVRLQAVPRQLRTAPRRFGTAPVVGVIAGLTLGIMTWRVLTTVEVSQPPPIVAEPDLEPVQAPETPQAMAPSPVQAPMKAAAIVTPVQKSQAPPITAAAIVTPVQDSPAPPIAPRSYVGSLSIDASPGGEVFVDRKNLGPTPVRLDNLRAGSHLVWVERDGYRRWTKVVQVPADRISRVFADLEAIADR